LFVFQGDGGRAIWRHRGSRVL